jgi:LEA14-like dessication related protein
MKKLFAKIFLTTIIVFSIAGTTCETLSAVFREPVLSLHSVELVNIDFNGVQLLCKVNVQNPNAIEIPFPEIGWEFFVNTNSFINGTIRNDQRIRARRTTVVDIPVRLEYLGVFDTFASLKESKQAEYKVALAAKFALPILGDRVWNFEHEGVFPVLQMPKLSMPSMKIDRIDFTRAELLFTVNVENPNEFDLPSPKLAYDYLVNNNSVIRSTLENSAPIAAAAVTPLIIRLEVQYADLYRSFQALRNVGEAPSKLSLTSDFALPAFAGNTFLTEIPGSLPLPKVPSITFGGLSVKNLSLTDIDFDVVWEVENPNVFAMSVKELAYTLTVNNTRWASGTAPASTQIAANRKTQIPLTFSINSLSMVRDITEMITRGTDVAYSCTGNISLGAALPGLTDYSSPLNFTGVTRLRR